MAGRMAKTALFFSLLLAAYLLALALVWGL